MIGKKAAGSLSLAEQIKQAQADANAYLDAQAQKVKEQSPGVPYDVIRMMITNRTHGCVCAAALKVLESE